MKALPKYKFNVERQFSAHHPLLQTAQRSLKAAEKQSDGDLYDELITIVFSALSIEAFCNAVGERVFESEWREEHERKGPAEKLELLTEKLNIAYNDKAEPWAAAIWLFKLRNDIAHAKPEFVTDEKELTQKQYDAMQVRTSFPNSKLENRINLSNAKRAFTAARDIKEIICRETPPENSQGLYVDRSSGSFSLNS